MCVMTCVAHAVFLVGSGAEERRPGEEVVMMRTQGLEEMGIGSEAQPVASLCAPALLSCCGTNSLIA